VNQLTQIEVAAVERFCLARLERFARLASQPEVGAVPQWRHLARHATLAAYRDCLTLGRGTEARRVLASARYGPDEG
jgi:hypothetical protein